MVCYARKQEKPFWFSLLGQMVQLGAIIFGRTLKNYFGQFVWIKKRKAIIIVAFHFMMRLLKKEFNTKMKKSHWNREKAPKRPISPGNKTSRERHMSAP